MKEKLAFVREAINKTKQLTIARIIATAIAAILMSIFSSRLHSLQNSLMLVGLVSFMTTILIEFFRVSLEVTKEAAIVIAEKKEIHALDFLHSSEENKEEEEKAEKDDDEIEVIEELIRTEIIVNGVATDSEKIVAIKENVSKTSLNCKIVACTPDNENHYHFISVCGKILKRIIFNRILLKYVLLFFAIATTSTIISYYLIESQDDVTPIVQHINPVEVVELSEQQKELIVTRAVDEIQEEIDFTIEAINENNQQIEEIANQVDAIRRDDSIEDLQEQIEDLLGEKQALQHANDELREEIFSLRGEITSLQDRMDELFLLFQEFEALMELSTNNGEEITSPNDDEDDSTSSAS